MARRPDPRIQLLREEAARLELDEKLNATQISKRMGFAAATVRSWLRHERGPKSPPFKQAVLDLLESGETDLRKIARLAGCGYENARKIERERRGFLKRTVRSGDQMLAEYLANPVELSGAIFTEYPTFGRAIIEKCNRSVSDSPKHSIGIIDLAESQFSAIAKRVKGADNVKRVCCNRAQVRAIRAGRERALSENQDHLEKALEMLRSAVEMSRPCFSCKADLARREARILGDLKRYEAAIARLDVAEATYRELGHSGHDIRKNGFGSCALERVTILHLSGQHKDAIALVDTTLDNLVLKREAFLYFRLRFNRTLSLLALPGRASEARSAAEDLLRDSGDAETLSRLHVVFLAGRAAEKTLDIEAALNHYEDAYDCATQLEIAAAIAALEADIGRLTDEPADFIDRIERLKELDDDGKPQGFPSWLDGISKILDQATKLATTDFHGAISFLRQEGGGDKLLPLGLTS